MAGFMAPVSEHGEVISVMPGILDIWPYCGDDLAIKLVFKNRDPITKEVIDDPPFDLTRYINKKAEIRTVGTKDLATAFTIVEASTPTLGEGLEINELVLYLSGVVTKTFEIYSELEWDMSFTYDSKFNSTSKVTVLKGKVYPKVEVTE